MGERERNQPYYGRHEGDRDFREERFPRGHTERGHDDRGDARRAYGGEPGLRGRDYDAERDTTASRYRGEQRDAAERERGARYGHEAQGLPNIYGSYDDRIDRADAERSRYAAYEPRFEREGQRGIYGRSAERNYVDERTREYRGPSAEGQYGADWRGSARARGYGRDDYRDYGERGFAQGDYYQRGNYYPQRDRDWPERNLAQRDWGEHSHPERPYDARPYGGEHDYHGRDYGRGRPENFGQQLRDAGHQVAQKVKRAFRGPKGYKRSDERIREDVSDRFAEQSYLDPSEIEITVSSGEVTLIGTVEFRNEKFVAEEIADDVSGVTDVHNQLRLRREQAPRAASGEAATSTATAGASNQNATEAARNRNARA